MSYQLRDDIVNDVRARSEWISKMEELHKRRLGVRPKIKKYPYEGAPNFVIPIIDDAIRERTDQELAMLFNVPSLVHAVPLDKDIPIEAIRSIERAMDTYLRYIIKCRRTVSQICDRKNEYGVAVAKIVHKYNHILKTEVPDFECKPINDVIVPPNTTHLQNAERIVDVIRLNERAFFERAAQRGWSNAQEVWEKCKRVHSSPSSHEDRSYFDHIRHLIGVSYNPTYNEIAIWAVYHYANDEDVQWFSIYKPDVLVEKGDKIVSLFAPEAPDLYLDRYPWRKPDTTLVSQQSLPSENAVEIVTQSVVVKGQERPWPFVAFFFDDRGLLFYEQRGIAELVVDDQIEATASKNAKYVMLEYYQNPMMRGIARNPQGVNFAPGSVFSEPDAEFIQPPNIPPQFDFSINDCKASAARRVGAVSMYNYSTDYGNRKLQKSATEAQLQQTNAVTMSSVGVDCFNESFAELLQILWSEMAEMNVQFPVLSESATTATPYDVSLYQYNVLLVPASSAKTLNPENLLVRMLSVASETIKLAQAGVIAIDAHQIWKDVLSQFDPRTANTWLLNSKQPSLVQTIEDIKQKLLSVGEVLNNFNARLTNVENLAATISKQTRSEGQYAVQATNKIRR